MTLAGEIRRLREQEGSHDKLAARLGTSRQTVIRWEAGSFPKPHYAAKLIELGVPPELLERPEPLDWREHVETELQGLKDALAEAVPEAQDVLRDTLLERLEALETRLAAVEKTLEDREVRLLGTSTVPGRPQP